MRKLAAAVGDGLPVYAECGGLVYLCEGLEDENGGGFHAMSGALPLNARMTGRRQALGYVEARALGDNPLMRAGQSARGHEFHWSAVEWSDRHLAYDCHSAREGASRLEGFNSGQVLASYVHLHFAGDHGAADRFVATCAGAGAKESRADAAS